MACDRWSVSPSFRANEAMTEPEFFAKVKVVLDVFVRCCHSGNDPATLRRYGLSVEELKLVQWSYRGIPFFNYGNFGINNDFGLDRIGHQTVLLRGLQSTPNPSLDGAFFSGATLNPDDRAEI